MRTAIVRLVLAAVLCVPALATQCAARGGAAAQSDDTAVARKALDALFRKDREALYNLYYETASAEAAARDARPLRPSDSILYLYNSTLNDRPQYLASMEAAARAARSEEMRTRILLALLDDEYYEMDELKGQNRYNRFTRVFNRASSSLSKLAMFQPQDAAQLVLDTVYGARKARHPSDRERKMLHLARVFLAKYPNAEEAPEVVELQGQLQAKLGRERGEREKASARLFLDKGSWAPAQFHLENARSLLPEDQEIAGLFQELEQGKATEEQAMTNAVMVSKSENGLSGADAAQLEKAARALLLGDRKPLDAVATGDGAMAPYARYGLASVMEKSGKHDAAVRHLYELAQSHPGAGPGLAATAVLSNTSYNLDAQFDTAVAEMEKKRKKYVLTGNRSREEGTYLLGSTAIKSTGQAASGLPFLFVTDILVRGVVDRFKTQIETDAVVDAGARYMRKYPDSSRTKEIAASLAALTKRASDYARSEEYLEMAETGTPQEIAKLRNNRARKYYDAAMASRDPAERKQLLQYVMEKYADCKIAATAGKELNKLPPTLDRDSIVLDRNALKLDPEFAAMIGLDPGLLDGRKPNDEITDPGIAIDASGARYSYRTKYGQEPVTSTLPKSGREQLLTRARSLRDAAQVRSAGSETVRRQRLPFAIDGGAGGSGVELSPKLIPAKELQDSKYYR